MKDRLSDEEAQALLKSLNELVEQGPWDKSNFLKAIGKNITKIRDDLVEKVGAPTPVEMHAQAQAAKQSALRTNQQEVFVSLYSSKGTDMSAWERIVTNLPRQMVSRPIYADEKDVQSSIKHKEHQINEAYVAIFIDKSAVLELSEEKTSHDKLGNKLLSLKDKSLNLDSISRFVHLTGIYQLESGRLLKKS